MKTWALVIGLTLGLTPAVTAQEPSADELKIVIAYLVVKSGHLCAQVKDIRPLRHADTYEVTCIAYRGGTGTKVYVLNARTAVVFPQ